MNDMNDVSDTSDTSGTILVLAGTGNVGGALVRELARRGERVRAATRAPQRMEPAPGVEPVRFDFGDEGTFGPALDGADRVFALAPTGVAAPDELMTPFLREAARDGARKIVLMTAFGVEADDAIPLREVERVVERSGAPYVLLRPNWFMDNFHTYWLGQIGHDGMVSVPAADARTAFVDVRDVAAAAAAALRTDRFDGRAFTLTGPEALGYAEAAAVLSRAAGREIRYRPVDDGTFTAMLVGAGMSGGYARQLAGLFAVVRQGHAAHVADGVRTLTGREPRTLERYAADHAEAWREPRPAAVPSPAGEGGAAAD